MAGISLPAELEAGIEKCFQDPEVRERSFYPEFRTAWCELLNKCAQSEEKYFDIEGEGSYTMRNSFMDMDIDFHIDQLKIADWYIKEVQKNKHNVFFGKRLKRSRKTGELMFGEAVCTYDPEAPEPALTDNIRNIVACALPCFPLRIQVVYGNKWVNSRFSILRRNSLDFFLIGTDYVPAFLGSPLEVVLYLFLMDYCIIKTDTAKMKDDELKKYLHIFRPSPMLRIKGLL